MGGRRVGGLNTRVGWKCCIGRVRGGPDGTEEIYKVKEEDTVLVGVGSPEKQGRS